MKTTVMSWTRWSAGLVAAGFLASGALADQKVPGGTVVMLEFLQDVSTRQARKGDEIKLRVYTDVVVNGKTVIRQDAPARGVVTDVKKPGPFGKRSRLLLRLDDVKDVNGDLVRLDPYTSGGRYRPEGAGVSGAGLLVLGPAGIVGGAFIKGSHITIKQGTRIQAKVAGEEKPNSPVKKDEKVPVEPK